MNRKTFITSLLGVALYSVSSAAIVAIPDNLPDDSKIYENVWNVLFTKDEEYGMLVGFNQVDGYPKLGYITVSKKTFRECLRKNEKTLWVLDDSVEVNNDLKYCMPKVFQRSYLKAI